MIKGLRFISMLNTRKARAVREKLSISEASREKKEKESLVYRYKRADAAGILRGLLMRERVHT